MYGREYWTKDNNYIVELDIGNVDFQKNKLYFLEKKIDYKGFKEYFNEKIFRWKKHERDNENVGDIKKILPSVKSRSGGKSPRQASKP